MARIRTVKPEFWTHEELSALPEATHLLAAALLNYSDDHGYFNANVGLVKAACSPLREPSVRIPESFRSLQTVGYLRFGTTPDDKRYGHIVKFDEHQRVSHPTKSKIGALSIVWEDSRITPEALRNPPESFRPEGKGKEQGKEGNREWNGSNSRIDQNALVDTIRGVYPAGQYRDSAWLKAAHFIALRLDAGVCAAQLLDAATAYAAQQTARGKIGTEFILSPAKFFESEWLGPFPLPVSADDQSLQSSLEAGREWLAGGGDA